MHSEYFLARLETASSSMDGIIILIDGYLSISALLKIISFMNDKNMWSAAFFS